MDDPCSVCGAYMVWADCLAGCDDGFIDCYEEDPLWYEPGDTRPCPECHGRGGWWECSALPHSAAQMAAWDERLRDKKSPERRRRGEA